jgi:hypothetical protein
MHKKFLLQEECAVRGRFWEKQSAAARDDPEFGLDLAAQALYAVRQEDAARRCKVVIVMNNCSLDVVFAIVL